jgi:hypothetical protein
METVLFKRTNLTFNLLIQFHSSMFVSTEISLGNETLIYSNFLKREVNLNTVKYVVIFLNETTCLHNKDHLVNAV